MWYLQIECTSRIEREMGCSLSNTQSTIAAPVAYSDTAPMRKLPPMFELLAVAV